MCVSSLQYLRRLSYAAAAAIFVFIVAPPSVVKAVEGPSASSTVTLKIPERLEIDLYGRSGSRIAPTARRVNATDSIPVQLTWWAASNQKGSNQGTAVVILAAPCQPAAVRWCAVVAEPIDH
jgi:hypothetical protein